MRNQSGRLKRLEKTLCHRQGEDAARPAGQVVFLIPRNYRDDLPDSDPCTTTDGVARVILYDSDTGMPQDL
jgi:hypothetical protein